MGRFFSSCRFGAADFQNSTQIDDGCRLESASALAALKSSQQVISPILRWTLLSVHRMHAGRIECQLAHDIKSGLCPP
jgi:hypothetical protein